MAIEELYSTCRGTTSPIGAEVVPPGLGPSNAIENENVFSKAGWLMNSTFYTIDRANVFIYYVGNGTIRLSSERSLKELDPRSKHNTADT